ncbi:MAG: two-component sensor histidine kinase [Dysgonamonadaceae bacterium]|jgi:signal transduction histidine kinase|nr:two-component sensor histidine kinase [Dysgonamonadaceae bacterium]
MKLSFAHKLSAWFCLILILFSVSLVVFEWPREKKHKQESMEERLDGYTGIIDRYLLAHNHQNLKVSIDSLLNVFPPNLRLTIINSDGKVLYDNRLDSLSSIENHAGRPEIRDAVQHGAGGDIRLSASTKTEYLYYAKRYGNRFIRVALPYDVQLKHWLKPDSAFLYYLLVLFVLGIVFMSYTAKHFGLMIKRLSDYSYALNHDLPVNPPVFPDNEIGAVSRQIAADYQRLKASETALKLEREKLHLHIQSSAEGVCFFTSDRKVAFYNGLFFQYLNMISDRLTDNWSERLQGSKMLHEEILAPIVEKLDNAPETTYWETAIHKQGKYFALHLHVFDDRSFEIVLNDRTRQEKNQRLKQELTGNIAHELRTPITGIRGYLETILETPLEREKEREFITKAYEQILLLSELIRDMSLLAKLNETPDTFQFQPVRLQAVIDRVQSDLAEALQVKNITIHSTVPPDTTVSGNENLLYSMFRNLTDNVINHAGEHITIEIAQYNCEGNFAYFSFSDNGAGIEDEKHLARLFERFYRVEAGRTRDTGGSGLGLAIVKNVVTFHGGTVSVKNRKHGGLEVLFSLPV